MWIISYKSYFNLASSNLCELINRKKWIRLGEIEWTYQNVNFRWFHEECYTTLPTQQYACPGVTTWCICGCSLREDVCRVDGCYRGGTVVMDVNCVDFVQVWFEESDLFVLSWARVQRVRRGSISSELLMCGGCVRTILLLPLVARCLETINVCIWNMFVFMSVVVTVWGYVVCLLCSGRCWR